MVDFPQLPPDGLDLVATLTELNERWTREALERCGGNVSAAARLLRIKRSTLNERITRARKRAKAARRAA